MENKIKKEQDSLVNKTFVQLATVRRGTNAKIMAINSKLHYVPLIHVAQFYKLRASDSSRGILELDPASQLYPYSLHYWLGKKNQETNNQNHKKTQTKPTQQKPNENQYKSIKLKEELKNMK